MPYIFKEWRRMSFIGLLTIATAMVSTLIPWPLKLLVDYALDGQALPNIMVNFFDLIGLETNALVLIFFAGVASFSLFALNTALSWGITWNWAVAGYRMFYGLAADMLARLQQLTLRFHGLRPVGDLLGRITTDSSCAFQLAANLLITPAGNLLTIVTVSSVAWLLDPILAMLLLTTVPLLTISAHVFGERLKHRSRLNREAQANQDSFVHQTLTAIPIVQAFTHEPKNNDRYAYLGNAIISRAQKGVITGQTFQMINGGSMAIATALVIMVGGQRVLSGEISLGSLLVFIAYALTLREAFISLMNTFAVLKATEASIDRVLEVLDDENEVLEHHDAKPFTRQPEHQGIAVTIEDVTFSYEAEYPILDNINLTVPAGKTVALIGATGAGKSTLASLIPRFFDPDKGRILFDGIDTRDIQLRSLRQQVAMVLQEPFLLPFSVAENIAYGQPDATQEQIVAAAAAANADEFIQKLPEGYDTVIGERGVTLSGGQRQRLAIARALLKDAPILILDEPTSALDNKTETLILEALERLMLNRTTFIIAHRLSTIRNADWIVVLKNGRIVEQGTQAELIKAKNEFWQYHTLQEETRQ